MPVGGYAGRGCALGCFCLFLCFLLIVKIYLYIRKIALIGYGKRGKTIERIALKRGHEIVLKVGIENIGDNTVENIRRADAAIEFTGPEIAFDNIIRCMQADVPVVCGS